MSWFRVDDAMFDHPKWLLALQLGGSDALHLWLKLGTWCSRHLTDGYVPAHVAATISIAGPRSAKSTARAWRALVESALCTRDEHGAYTLCNYLDYNPSRAKVTAERERKTKNKQDQRDRENVTGDRPGTVTGDSPRPVPSRPLPSPPQGSAAAAHARDPDPPSSPTVTEIRPLARAPAPDAAPEQTQIRPGHSDDAPPRAALGPLSDVHDHGRPEVAKSSTDATTRRLGAPTGVTPDGARIDAVKRDVRPTNPGPLRASKREQELQAAAARLPGSAPPPKVYEMPSEEPPESYLQAAIMEAVHPEQARATWRHYWLEGLPPRGVERLHPWLLEQARGFASRNTKVTAARAGPRRASSERGAVMAMMAEEIERDRAEEAERKARSGKV